jgi:hypothetical protein
MFGENIEFGGQPAIGHTDFQDAYPPGTPLRTPSAGGASPYLFVFHFGQPEGGLPDQFTHTEVANPVPGADRIAQSALIAVFEGFSALVLNDIDDLFEVGNILHCLS